MRVQQVVFESGERFPVLVDADGVPDFWVTLYTSQKLRSQTQSSINAFVRSVTHLYKWQIIHGRDLVDELRQTNVVDLSTLELLKEHCGLKNDYIRKEMNGESLSKVASMNRFTKSKNTAMSLVGFDLQKRRMHDIALFLEFVGRELFKGHKNYSALVDSLNEMRKTFKAHYPKSKYQNLNRRLGHADKNAFEKFMDITSPGSEKNPFKGYENKIRNYLLIQLLYWTGARSAEVLSLTLDDLDYDVDSPSISIHRRHDDSLDPRKYQPVAKTRGREIQIPPFIRDELDYYINKVRSKFRKAKQHPYIFVSHKGPTSGLPMTNSNFYNRVILTAKSVDNELFYFVKRHGFRHFFNERLSEQIDGHNLKIDKAIIDAERRGFSQQVAQLKRDRISEQQEIDMRASLMGWSNKDSAKPYIERHVKNKAKNMHLQMMQEMSQILRKD